MAKYNLQPNEILILREEGVMHGGVLASYTDELVLTNLSLIVLKKGLFGNSKGVLTFPLDQIKVHNGKAQALLTKGVRGMPRLEVYFQHGQETFEFRTPGKKSVLQWIAKINEAVTGEEAPASDPGLAIPGAALVADTIKDTIDVFKGRFSPKANAPAAQTAEKCSACGAPMSGRQGTVVTCEYCGTAQQL